MKIRGYLALGIICIAFPFFDLYQKLVVAPSIRLRPSRRIPTMTSWINRMRSFAMGCLTKVGGARISTPERVVSSGPDVLIVMNHQSILDIPLVVGLVRDGYPRIVTRARYHRFIPLISHMVRLYQYPVVDPRASPEEVKQSLDELSEAATTTQVPLAIFPEGTRTRDGSIGRFKTRGLNAILSQRTWTVRLFVADGFWSLAKFKDFVGGMAHLNGQVVDLGTLEWRDPAADPTEFIREMRAVMIRGLAELRAGKDPTGQATSLASPES